MGPFSTPAPHAACISKASHLLKAIILGALALPVFGSTTSLKLYIYDLPQWKDPSKFIEASKQDSKHADIR